MAKANPLYKKLLPEFIELVEVEKLLQSEAVIVLHKKYDPPMGVKTLRVKLNNLYVKHLKSDDIVKSISRTNDETYTEGLINTDAFQQYCREEGLDISKVKSVKYVNHAGQQKFNVVMDYASIIEKDIDFDSIIAKHIKPVEYTAKKIKTDYLFDRLVYTDVHVGMNVNKDGFSLYGGEWDEEALEETLTEMINHILSTKKSNTLVIDDLGDFADGWNGQTARGGHDLPQNMDNEKAFDVGLNFKVKLTEALSQHYKKIIVHNICNSNHSGSGFDYVINSAYKRIIEAKLNNVEVINYRKFIEHYNIGKYYFVISHGKDAKNLKFGFKPKLDDKQVEKIKNYIDVNEIPRDALIEFSKGDSHQYLFDNSTSDTFNYYNYPALSPSSEWVQTNFKRGRRGFVSFNYAEDKKTINEFIF